MRFGRPSIENCDLMPLRSKLNVAIFFHPEGSLFAEEGEYMAEEKGEDIQEKSLAKNKYLKGVAACHCSMGQETPKDPEIKGS